MPIRSCSRATLERARCNYSRIPVGDDISPCFGLSGASARWQNMKSRHAAALALAGWYLMVPPPLLHGNPPVDLDAPLSEWRLFSMHKSAAECEKGLVAFYKLAKAELIANPLMKGTGYNSTSLRTLSASPATTLASRQNDKVSHAPWLLRFSCSPAGTPRGAASAASAPEVRGSPGTPTAKAGH
jgi:hypothetical protein